MLTDFGLARAIDDASITRTGIIAGTPQYMSPEQARGEPVDSRSDLFSLGSVLYTLATGRPPFRAESTYAILRRLTDEPPRPLREVAPQYPAWLGVLIHKLLEKQPSDRWTSSTEVAQLLEQCVANVQQPAVFPLPTACQVAEPTRWRLSRSSIAITVVLAMLLAVGMTFLPQRISRSPIPDSTSSIMSAPPPTESGGRQPAEAPTPPPDPTTEWNHGEDSLVPLRQELDEWTRDAQQLWKKPK